MLALFWYGIYCAYKARRNTEMILTKLGMNVE